MGKRDKGNGRKRVTVGLGGVEVLKRRSHRWGVGCEADASVVGFAWEVISSAPWSDSIDKTPPRQPPTPASTTIAGSQSCWPVRAPDLARLSVAPPGLRSPSSLSIHPYDLLIYLESSSTANLRARWGSSWRYQHSPLMHRASHVRKGIRTRIHIECKSRASETFHLRSLREVRVP
jgi:hypothetical protein